MARDMLFDEPFGGVVSQAEDVNYDGRSVGDMLDNGAYIGESRTAVDHLPINADLLGGKYSASDIDQINNDLAEIGTIEKGSSLVTVNTDETVLKTISLSKGTYIVSTSLQGKIGANIGLLIKYDNIELCRNVTYCQSANTPHAHVSDVMIVTDKPVEICGFISGSTTSNLEFKYSVVKISN